MKVESIQCDVCGTQTPVRPMKRTEGGQFIRYLESHSLTTDLCPGCAGRVAAAITGLKNEAGK